MRGLHKITASLIHVLIFKLVMKEKAIGMIKAVFMPILIKSQILLSFITLKKISPLMLKRRLSCGKNGGTTIISNGRQSLLIRLKQPNKIVLRRKLFFLLTWPKHRTLKRSLRSCLMCISILLPIPQLIFC